MTGEQYIQRRSPRWPTAMLRICMGYLFIAAGVHRLLLWMADHAVLRGALVKLQRVEQFPWFRTYLDRVISRLSDSDLFTWLLIAGPMLIGVMLVLGLLTRLSAVGGILLVLNSYFITFYSAGVYEALALQMQVLVLAVLFFAAAGRTFGMDGIFWRHRVLEKFAGPAGGKAGEAPKLPEFSELEPIPLSESKPPAGQVPGRVEQTVGLFSTQVKPKPPSKLAPKRTPPKEAPKLPEIPEVESIPLSGEGPAVTEKKTEPPPPAPKPEETVRLPNKPDLEPIPLAGEEPEEQPAEKPKPEDAPTEEKPEPPVVDETEPIPLADDGEILVMDMDQKPTETHEDTSADKDKPTDTGT